MKSLQRSYVDYFNVFLILIRGILKCVNKCTSIAHFKETFDDEHQRNEGKTKKDVSRKYKIIEQQVNVQL